MQQTNTVNDNLFQNTAQCLGADDLNAIVNIALQELIEHHRPAAKRRQPPASIAGKAEIIGDLVAPCVPCEGFECLRQREDCTSP